MMLFLVRIVSNTDVDRFKTFEESERDGQHGNKKEKGFKINRNEGRVSLNSQRLRD